MEQKACIHCGTSLPAEASFCPVCTALQKKKQAIQLPSTSRKRHNLLIVSVLVAVASVALALYIISDRPEASVQEPTPQEESVTPYEPITVEGDAYLTYPTENGNYQLFVFVGAGKDTIPSPYITTRIAPGNFSDYPLRLMVYHESDDTHPLTVSFTSMVEHITLTATPKSGGTAMEVTPPAYDYDFPESALTSYVRYSAENLTNEFCWTIVMKNGDILRLTHVIEVIPIQELSFHLEDQTDQTFEELQAFIADLEQTMTADSRAILYLPAVTYHGTLELKTHSISLRGMHVGKEMTTFVGPQQVLSSGITAPDFQNIRFTAPGETGILVNCGVRFFNCEFLNCKTAIAATDGGSVGIDDCVFRNNEVGVLYDTTHHRFFANSFTRNIFRENGIAFWLKMLPNNIELNFSESVFSDNTVAILNECNHPISTEGAVFE